MEQESQPTNSQEIPASFEIIKELVKSNNAILDAVDGDKKLRKKYEEDSKNLSQVQTTVDNLLAMIVDQVPMSSVERGRDRILPNARIPKSLLRRAGMTEIPRMIKNLRRFQLTQFGQPASRKKFGKETGFSLYYKDPNFQPTEKEKKALQDWEVRFTEKFFFPAGEAQPSFVKFLGACYEDYFDLDDITLEKLRDGLNAPIGMQLQDPAQWYPTVNKVKQVPPRFDDDMIFKESYNEMEVEEARYDYVQIMNEKKILGATRDRITKNHFFVRSDWRTWRKGYGIVEQSVNTTTTIMNAFMYNSSNFTKNKTPQGLLALSGEGMNNQTIVEKFKKILWASMTGVGDKKRIPIVGLPAQGKADWVSMYNTPKELEFYTGITLFSSIIFALSGTNPNESGFASFRDSVKTSTLSEPNQDGVWKQSQDNGLKTFLTYMEEILNQPNGEGKNIFEEATNLPIRCEFKGLASEDMKMKTDINKARLEQTASFNDLLLEEGKEKRSLVVAEGVDIYDLPAIANAQLSQFVRGHIQNLVNKEQQEQQAQQQAGQQAGGQQGEGGAPPEGTPQELSDEDRALVEQYGSPE